MNPFLITTIILSVLIISSMVLVLQKYELGYLISKFSEKELADISLYTDPVLPDYLSFDKPSFGFDNVSTPEEFDNWKRNLREKITEVFDIPDEILIENLQVVEKNDNLTKYTVDAFDGDTIIFYELLPEMETNHAVIIFPGSGNQGARDVLGIDSEMSEFYYHQEVGLKVASQNYAVYVIEQRGWGERQIDAGSLCIEKALLGVGLINCSGIAFARILSSHGMDLGRLQLIDALTLTDYVRSLGYEKVTVMGLSLGGGSAMFSAALRDDVTNAVLASAISSVEKSYTFDADGMLQYFDVPDIVSMIAPRPVYMSWGLNENLPFRFEAETLYSTSKIQEAYEVFNATENIIVLVHDDTFSSGHNYQIDSVLRFLEGYS